MGNLTLYRKFLRALTVFAVVALLFSAGCKVGPNYRRPIMAVPADWRWKPSTSDVVQLDSRWWQIFNDEKLNELQTLALQANQDIQRAVARVDEARALARLNKADFFPQITVNPTFNRQGDSANFIPGGGGFSPDRHPRNFFSLPLNISYEADVWGRIRRGASAARERAEARVADYHAVILTVTSDVAVNYFLMQALDAEIDVLQNNQKLREEFLKLVDSQFKFGAVGALDVARAKTDVATTVASLVDVKRRREQVVHVLAILCGKPASGFTIDFRPLKLPPPVVPAGLPSTLLQRRPDVVAAERELIATNEEIGVAQAAFYPRLALTGNGGFESSELNQLFDWKSTAWQVAANIVQPVFTGGRNKAQLDAARARYDQAQADYRQQILVAFKEVEDALLDMRFRADEAAAVAEAVAASRDVTKLATTRYEAGQVSQIEVVDAQRRQLELEQQATQILGQRLVATVRLVRALGGGWNGELRSPRTDWIEATPATETPEALPPPAHEEKSDLVPVE